MTETEVKAPTRAEPTVPAAGSGGTDPYLALQELADPVAAWAVRAAATLRLPDLIAEGHADLDALAERAGVDADRLGRLMRYLITRKLFGSDGAGRYTLTGMSQLLRDGAPGGMRDYLDLAGAPCRLDRTTPYLLETVRTGEPGYRLAYGRDPWLDLSADPALGASFDLAMVHKSRLMAPGIVAARDWGSFRHIVDVGGGNGIVLAEILRSAERLRGTLVERPETAAGAKPVLAEAGVADRCTVVGGDFFAELPRGGDAYLLMNVLHDWDDERAEAILRRCAEAAGTDGRVIIIEFLVDGASDQAMVTRWDLLMLLGAGGRERTADQYASLAGKVGLHVDSITPTATGVNLLECLPNR